MKVFLLGAIFFIISYSSIAQHIEVSLNNEFITSDVLQKNIIEQGDSLRFIVSCKRVFLAPPENKNIKTMIQMTISHLNNQEIKKWSQKYSGDGIFLITWLKKYPIMDNDIVTINVNVTYSTEEGELAQDSIHRKYEF